MGFSVHTGFEKAFGMPFFEYLANHPADASMFSETMVGFHGSEPAAVAAAYDFSQFEAIIDVGGATGNLLATILGRHPEPRGVLFDLPHVVRDAPALIEARGLVDRITIEAGTFFESVPYGTGAYLLSHIIHDWSEAQCLTILGNCRRAMKVKNARAPLFRPPWAPNPAERLVAWRSEQLPRDPNRKLSARARGYDRDWDRLRAAILAEEPMCRECARRGIERAAQTLDHVVPIRDAPELRLDPTNLQPLCWPCHRRKTNSRDGGFGHRRRLRDAEE
jgi:hypothetical protein